MQHGNITDETRKHYDELIAKIGDQYFHDRWMSNPVAKSHYHQTVKTIKRIFKEKISSDTNDMLEIGSGPGTWTPLCLGVAKSLTLFDISNEFLNVVRRQYKDEPKLIDFICGDFVEDASKLGDRSFDMIFSGRALEYMSDKKAVVSHCRNLLKPSGKLIIITKNPEWRDKVAGENKHDIHRGQIYWKDLVKIFEQNNFRNILLRPAAIGSYYFPYNNILGIQYCNFKYSRIAHKPMTTSHDRITESYIIYGEKP